MQYCIEWRGITAAVFFREAKDSPLRLESGIAIRDEASLSDEGKGDGTGDGDGNGNENAGSFGMVRAVAAAAGAVQRSARVRHSCEQHCVSRRAMLQLGRILRGLHSVLWHRMPIPMCLECSTSRAAGAQHERLERSPQRKPVRADLARQEPILPVQFVDSRRQCVPVVRNRRKQGMRAQRDRCFRRPCPAGDRRYVKHGLRQSAASS